MGKIRRAIANFIHSRRVDDKRHPRFRAGYLAGLYDARLEAETTHEDGIIRLEKWPDEHVLWYHGEIVWRSGSGAAPAPEKHAEWGDWTVDDTDTAHQILNYLGYGADASREPGADRRRDKIAVMIRARIDAATAPVPSTHMAAPQCCMCGKKNLSTVEGDGGSECELENGIWACSAECWDRAAEPAQDVINLVIAAREFWDFRNDLSEESVAMDKALEAFASRVPYANEPSATTGGQDNG